VERHFYKYRSLDKSSKDFTKKSIIESEMFFPSPNVFNDPFDCKPKISCEATVTEFKLYLESFYERKFPWINGNARRNAIKNLVRDNTLNNNSTVVYNLARKAIYDEFAAEIGVYCVSEKGDDILMWSHYSDSHRGICLRFKVDNNTRLFKNIKKVFYQENRIVINFIKDTPADFQNKILYFKSKAWEYEQEWRGVNEHNGVANYDEEILDAVILGAKISKDDIQEVVEWCNSKKCRPKILKANLHKDKYAIEIKE